MPAGLDQSEISLAYLPPAPRQTWWAVAWASVLLIGLGALAPFATRQLPQTSGFIPALDAMISVTDLITASLLFAHFSTTRSRALLALACGYFFSALIVVAHGLSFPGVVSPAGEFGGSSQTTLRIYLFWHLALPVALFAYVWLRHRDRVHRDRVKATAHTPAAFVVGRSVVGVVALVTCTVWIAAAGDRFLPYARVGVDYSSALVPWIVDFTMVLCAAALSVVWVFRHSALDQWLMVAVLASIVELAITALFGGPRFTLGFYTGRAFSLVTSTAVLTVLLTETTTLYARLARANTLASLSDANIIGILIANLEGHIREANQAFLRLVGYDRADLEAGRLSRTELTPVEWHDRDAQAMAEMTAVGLAQPYEKEYFRKDGGRVPVLIGGATFGERRDAVVAFVVDLTERKRAEAELAHANRVAIMGQLTASIAHEVSQPLTGLLISAETALRALARKSPKSEEIRPMIERVISDGNRTAEIVKRIRSFSRKVPGRSEDLEMNEAILDIMGLARVAMSNNGVVARMQLTEGLPHIRGDRVQLQQVILNLTMNAIEAMSEIKDGPRELSISTSEESDSVLVAVSDSGPGVPRAGLPQIFEAFYSTKTDGLGMGLSICRSIVEAHHGRLWMTPNEPCGAVFYLMLPVASR